MDSVNAIYAPPSSHQAQLHTGYYKCTLGKIGYMEIARMSPIWTIPIIWGIKLLGNDMVLMQGLPDPESFETMRVPAGSLPPVLQTALAELFADAAPLGFENPIYYRQSTSLVPGNENFAAAVCRHRDGNMIANLIAYVANGKNRKVTGIISGFDDGTFFSTGNDKKQFTPNPRNGGLYMPGKTTAELVAGHATGCKEWGAKRQVRHARTTQEIGALLHDYEVSAHRWHVERGVYQLMTLDEIAVARRQHASTVPNKPIGELSFNLLFVDEYAPIERPAAATLTAKVITAASKRFTTPESNWLINYAGLHGSASLALRLHTHIAMAEPGKKYAASFKRSGSGTYAALRSRAATLLGEDPALPLPPPVKELALTIEFIGRTNDVTDGPRTAKEHVFRLNIPEVTGTFILVLNPSLEECRLVPEHGLDRASAYAALAALLQ